MFTNFKRAFRFAVKDFHRNRGISVAAIVVLAITILVATSLFFVHGMSNFLVETVKDKIDITAYFTAETPEEDILRAKDQLLAQVPTIKNVEYVSRDQALEDFNARHQDDPIFSRALSEVGENPFLPSLNITTNEDPAQYEHIATVLQDEQFANIIEKIDFSQKQGTIEKIFSIISKINMFGLIVGGILIIIVLLVVFNTIKLVIESSREEINTMKIVGASNWFVRAPFIIEGGIFGFVAFIICVLVTFLLVYVLSPGVSAVLPGFSLFGYFISHLFLILLLQLAVGVGLGVISSFIVVRRYLR